MPAADENNSLILKEIIDIQTEINQLTEKFGKSNSTLEELNQFGQAIALIWGKIHALNKNENIAYGSDEKTQLNKAFNALLSLNEALFTKTYEAERKEANAEREKANAKAATKYFSNSAHISALENLFGITQNDYDDLEDIRSEEEYAESSEISDLLTIITKKNSAQTVHQNSLAQGIKNFNDGKISQKEYTQIFNKARADYTKAQFENREVVVEKPKNRNFLDVVLAVVKNFINHWIVDPIFNYINTPKPNYSDDDRPNNEIIKNHQNVIQNSAVSAQSTSAVKRIEGGGAWGNTLVNPQASAKQAQTQNADTAESRNSSVVHAAPIATIATLG